MISQDMGPPLGKHGNLCGSNEIQKQAAMIPHQAAIVITKRKAQDSPWETCT